MADLRSNNRGAGSSVPAHMAGFHGVWFTTEADASILGLNVGEATESISVLLATGKVKQTLRFMIDETTRKAVR